MPHRTPEELARLLNHSADTINDLRGSIKCHHSKVHDISQGDIVFDLRAMAQPVDLFPPEKISEALKEAAEVIETVRALMELKRGVHAAE